MHKTNLFLANLKVLSRLKLGMEIPSGRLVRYFHTWLLCMNKYDIPGHVLKSRYEANILST